MVFKSCIIFSLLSICVDSKQQKFGSINMFRALAKNDGIFKLGFTTTYVGEDPFTFEHYLFIGKDFWKVQQIKGHDREFCVPDLESHQHLEFDHKFSLGFSYLSDHLVEHDDELNLTNHVLLQLSMKSSELYPLIEFHELIENAFDANHKNLHILVYGDYYTYDTHHFNATAAFQPQSFTDDGETDGPNFVLVQQNMTADGGYDRVSEVHSLENKSYFKNTTDTFGQYIPEFIKDIDRHLYINAILPTRIGEDTEEGDPAAILILFHEGNIKYCVTEETALHEDCKPENLRQLLRCPFARDEL